ncbi:MAG TPA: hypothetical protein VJ785_10950 [Anaerolineales bacterium]|nr:hypothetical protein [Anaerolineales bacterium]
MKKILLGLLILIVALVLLGAVGYAGYRYGFRQGALAASDGDAQFLMPGFGLGRQRMPMHDFGFDERGFDRGGFGIRQRGFAFGFFPPFGLLLQLLFWGLILWAIYMLVTRSGWRLTRTTQTTDTQQKQTQTEVQEQNQSPEN